MSYPSIWKMHFPRGEATWGPRGTIDSCYETSHRATRDATQRAT